RDHCSSSTTTNPLACSDQRAPHSASQSVSPRTGGDPEDEGSERKTFDLETLPPGSHAAAQQALRGQTHRFVGRHNPAARARPALAALRPASAVATACSRLIEFQANSIAIEECLN